MTAPEVRAAGIVSRGVAGVVDVLVVLVVLAVVYVGWVFVRLGFSPRAFSFLATLYLAACWAVSGRTVGAVMMGIEVVGRGQRRLSPATAALRALGCVFFPIGLGWVSIDRDRRSAQDIVLGTRVIYRGG